MLYVIHRLGLDCKGIHEVTPSEGTLSRAHAERVVGWALSSLLLDASVLLPPQVRITCSRLQPFVKGVFPVYKRHTCESD